MKKKCLGNTQIDSVNSESEWTEKDELQLLTLHKLHQNKWSIIQNSLPSKSVNEIKNHFYSILRKGMRKITIKDYKFSDALDVVQSYYIAKHLFEHLVHPNKKIKKNYLKTLVEASKLKLCSVNAFIDVLVAGHPDVSTLIFSEANLSDYLLKSSPEKMKLKRVLPSPANDKFQLKASAMSYEDKLAFYNCWMKH
jgi:hypothetical protein